MKTILLTVPLLILFSCSKEVSTPPEVKDKATKFSAFVKTGKFQLVAFYSDIPIDYKPNDASTEKVTDHWNHVMPHVKDDHLQFSGANAVTITQNAVKAASIPDEEITRPYKIGTLKNSVVFDFVDYNYNPLRYQLHELTSTSFTVYVNRDNAKLFSTFKIIQ